MCLVVHKSEVPQLLTEDKIVYKIVEFDTAEPCVCHAKNIVHINIHLGN